MISGFAYRMVESGQPLVRQDVEFDDSGEQALVKVLGCGVCHTDIGFLHDGVRTRKPAPIALGHEIVGEVLAGAHKGEVVVIPAVMPCGECRACRAGRPGTCGKQLMPGNDIDGGFASHILVPNDAVQPVPASGAIESWMYAAAGDAVSTAWSAVASSGAGEGDTVVVVGAGGVGGFAAQIARFKGARVLALDIDEGRCAELKEHGGVQTLVTAGMDAKDVRNAVSGLLGKDRWGWKILECSGSAPGQEAAFGLLGHAGHMGVVGYTMKTVTLRLSNLMAFEAELKGTWGCAPSFYPEVLAAMASGGVSIAPFVEAVGMAEINDVLDRVHAGGVARRPILLP